MFSFQKTKVMAVFFPSSQVNHCNVQDTMMMLTKKITSSSPKGEVHSANVNLLIDYKNVAISLLVLYI